MFEVDDFEADWLYRKPFDFIHSRELEGCIADSDRLFHQAFHHLNPGGYIEMEAVYPQFVSDDETAKNAKDAQKWMDIMCDGAAKFGKPWDIASTWEEKLKSAGFTDVQQSIHKVSRRG